MARFHRGFLAEARSHCEKRIMKTSLSIQALTELQRTSKGGDDHTAMSQTYQSSLQLPCRYGAAIDNNWSDVKSALHIHT